MFSNRVCEKLGYYVYLYIDPRDKRPFYVGKGKGNRCFSHVNARGESEKVRRVSDLRKLGLKPEIDILRYGLPEPIAELLEAASIEALGLHSLTNRVRGRGSRNAPRCSVRDIAAFVVPKHVTVREKAILININRLYEPDMSLQSLYDATRSAWKIQLRRAKEAKYALSIYRGVVREVFVIQDWVPGGSTMKARDVDGRPPGRRSARWEFVGQVAEERIRRKYRGRAVKGYDKPGAQNPIRYINC